jgi:hypothetical protein
VSVAIDASHPSFQSYKSGKDTVRIVNGRGSKLQNDFGWLNFTRQGHMASGFWRKL